MSGETNVVTVMETVGAPPKRYEVEFFDGGRERLDSLPPITSPFWSLVTRITETTVGPPCPITIGFSSSTN